MIHVVILVGGMPIGTKTVSMVKTMMDRLVSVSNMSNKSKDKDKDTVGIIVRSDKKRYCDICNVEIQSDGICGKCGVYYQPTEGKREIVIKGLDGKTKHGDPNILVSVLDDKPKPKDLMPKSFKLLERGSFKITGWTDSSQ